MALGANRVTIARLTLQQGGILVLVGVAVGLLGSRLATRVLESMLYQVTTSDPSALLAVVASFVAAALVGATYQHEWHGRSIHRKRCAPNEISSVTRR
jgi:putative ABC transport system permease protein